MKHFKKIAIMTILAGLACVRMTYAADPLPVFVSIPPQKYFVEKIGGNRVNVSIMVTPGSNPHNYEPKPNQMTALSKAKIYFHPPQRRVFLLDRKPRTRVCSVVGRKPCAGMNVSVFHENEVLMR